MMYDNGASLISPSLSYQELYSYHSSAKFVSPVKIEGSTITSNNQGSPIGFFTIKDKNNNLHIINNGIPTTTITSSGVSQAILYKSGLTTANNNYREYAENITYLGDVVASLLSNIYATAGEVVSDTILDITNAIYLNQYSTIFQADIVNKLEVITNKNLLCILSMNFDEYVDAVKIKCVGDKQFADSKNVKLTINSIMKTTPIQLKYKYYKPTITDSKQGYKYKICKSDGSEPIYSNQGFYANTMYYIKPGGDQLSQLDTSFSYQPRYNWKEEGNYLISQNQTAYTVFNPYLKDNFELVGRELVCSNTSTSIESSKQWNIHGLGSKRWAEIWPINKKEVLIGNSQYAR